MNNKPKIEKLDKYKIFYSATLKTIFLMIACVLPLNVFVLLDVINMTQEIRKEVALTTKNVADVYINTLDNIMENSDYMIFDLVNNNPDFITMSKQKNNTDYVNARHRCFWKLNDITELRSEGDGFFFYMVNKQDLVLAVSNNYDREKKNLHKFLSEDNNLNVTVQWHIIELEDKQWLLRVMKNKKLYYGAIINLDSRMKEILDSMSFDSSRASFDIHPMKGKKNTVSVFSQSNKADLYLNISISNSEIINKMSLARKGSFLLAITFFSMIPILYLFMRNMLINPVKNLNKAHYQLQIGNQDYRINEHANTAELESAYQSFNNMADNIKKLKIENMEKELAKKKMELNNLQLQIRPHFLLNTFNMIFILTERKDYESIRDLILYLSDYFRYIYRSGKELELFEKELRLIEGYMKAASIRYPDRILINYHIDPMVLLVRVPPLLIHNFIENIINHALLPDKIINIILFASYEDGIITFQISDDGKGMDEDVVQEINEERFRRNDERVHVGIQNSIGRLKYFYGEEVKLHVESELGEGTLITLTFPYNLEEE